MFAFGKASLLLCVGLEIISIAFSSWVDPDTLPQDRITKSYHNGKEHVLVFSDEFNVENRDFIDGHDPRWTAMNKNDYTNFALHYYSQDLARTTNGYLNISTIKKDITFSIPSKVIGKSEKMTKNYQSAMINGWNKFCFTGGIIEFRAKLPGKYDIGGLWPAMWLLGNLARSTYVGSSDNIWPWSMTKCNRKYETSQEISGCAVEHHWDVGSNQGRGAPEIDILEAMPGKEKLINTPINKPYFSASLQVSPAIKYRPITAVPPDLKQWYHHGLEYGKNTSLNIFFYGMTLLHATPVLDYNADAISANRDLQETHFTDFHTYRLEWVQGPHGYLRWYLDGEFIYNINASALNITSATLPEEPMYILLNTAMSSTWGFPVPCPKYCGCDCFDCEKPECLCGCPNRMCKNFPANFLIDSVRVYQDPSNPNQTVGCSPPGHRTKKWILGHAHRYMGEKDKVMMKEVVQGGYKCTSDAECGKGRCAMKKCVCDSDYTGPRCLAAIGFDDIDWDPDDYSLNIRHMFVPTVLIVLVALVVLGLLATVGYKYMHERKQRGAWRMNSMGQYQAIN